MYCPGRSCIARYPVAHSKQSSSNSRPSQPPTPVVIEFASQSAPQSFLHNKNPVLVHRPGTRRRGLACLGRAAARSHIIRRKTVVIHFGSQCPTRQPAQSSVEIHSTLAQPDWKTVVIQFGSELAAQTIGIYPPSKSSRHQIKPLSIVILLK